ncbi:MAG: cupin domain-containing protein [Pikeienuella sp.]|uniref:cupin domain-containing protein n=1 Tax=Pikeienuella sp. TaxID=2831957 RepID=UPI00391B629B
MESESHTPADPGAIDEQAEELRALGKRLRAFRRLKRLRLKDLAARAGCSESLLSRVENGIVMPSLTTLHRVARALEINVAALLTPPTNEPCTVYRPGARPRYVRSEGIEGDGSVADSLIPFAESRRLEGLLIRLPAGGAPCGPFEHEGEEVGYVLEGALELVVDGQSHHVEAGDSFFFCSDVPHSYRASGFDGCLVLWINTPPTF